MVVAGRQVLLSDELVRQCCWRPGTLRMVLMRSRPSSCPCGSLSHRYRYPAYQSHIRAGHNARHVPVLLSLSVFPPSASCRAGINAQSMFVSSVRTMVQCSSMVRRSETFAWESA